MDSFALVRGLTEDHPSSEDDVASRPRAGSKPTQPRHMSNSGAGAAGDPHDLIRGMTEDVWSSDDEVVSRPRPGPVSTAGPPKPTSQPSSGPPSATVRSQQHRPSAASNNDPHALIRGLTEDHWSSDEDKKARPSSSGQRKNMLSPVVNARHRLSSNSSRPEKPVGDPHDLIRGITEDPWTSSEDEAPGTHPRKTSTGASAAVKPVPSGSATKKLPLSPKKLPKVSPTPRSASLNYARSELPPVKVLMVCLGNICRSPMAHGILQHLTQPGLLPPHIPPVRVDSAGTGAYHVLSPPDNRTMELLRMHNIKHFVHTARKVRAQDFWDFDYMLCMDAENLSDLNRRQRTLVEKSKRDGRARGEPRVRIQLLGEYGGNETEIIEDPYYGSNEGFDVAWEQCVRCARGFMKQVLDADVDVSELMD